MQSCAGRAQPRPRRRVDPAAAAPACLQLPPIGLRLGLLTAISCGLAMLPRALKGSAYKASKLPEKPLVYW